MSNPWSLTPRQAEVMTQLAECGRSKTAAAALGMEARSVDKQVTNALKAMGTNSRVRAAVMWDRWAREQQR